MGLMQGHLCTLNLLFAQDFFITLSLLETAVLIEDPKQLENINNTAVNDMSLEQCCSVTEEKTEWFNMN